MTSIAEAARLAVQPHEEPQGPVPTLKLYEISSEYEMVISALQENGGELTADLEAALERVNEAFDCKAEKVCLYVRNLLSLASAAKGEIERLQALAKSRTTAAESLKDYLFREMQRVGKEKIERPLAKLRIQANSVPSIQCDHPETLPTEYQHITVSYSVDRDAVLRTLKNNQALPEGIVVERKSHLRIS